MTLLYPVLNALPAPCLIVNVDSSDHLILFSNRAFNDLLHIQTDIRGKSLADVINQQEHAFNIELNLLRLAIEDAVTTGMPTAPATLLSEAANPARGFRYYVKATIIPIRDEEGNTNRVLISLENNTALTHAGNRLARYDAVLQRQLIEAIATTKETERLKIGRELHDNIHQLLNTARLYLERVIAMEHPGERFLKQAHALIEQGLREIRTLSHELNHSIQPEASLIRSIEDLLDQLTELKSIQVIRDQQLPDESALPDHLKTSLIRIVQELVANIIRHSGADTVYLSLRYSPGMLSLTVHDNGCGFDARQQYAGMGLRNIKSRVSELNGTFQLISEPGKGCKIQVEIPIEDA